MSHNPRYVKSPPVRDIRLRKPDEEERSADGKTRQRTWHLRDDESIEVPCWFEPDGLQRGRQTVRGPCTVVLVEGPKVRLAYLFPEWTRKLLERERRGGKHSTRKVSARNMPRPSNRRSSK